MDRVQRNKRKNIRNQRKKSTMKNAIKKHKYKLMLFVLPVIIAVTVLCIKFKSEDKVYAIDDSVFISSLATTEDANSKGEIVTWYVIDNELQFVELMDYTSRHDCNGMYFKISDQMKEHISHIDPSESDEEGSETGIPFHVSLVGKKTYLDENDEPIYKNILLNGFSPNCTIPFRGTINFNGLMVRTDTPLFCFMGTGAHIENVSIWGDITDTKMNEIVGKNATLGALASMVILDGSDEVYINQIGINNGTTITTSSGKSVGGLIGTILGNPSYLSKGYNNATGNNDYELSAYNTEFNVNINQITMRDSTEYNRVTRFYCSGNSSTSYNNPLADKTKGTLADATPAATGGLIGMAFCNNENSYININLSGINTIVGELENDKYGVGGLVGVSGPKVKVQLSGTYDLSGVSKINGYDTYKCRGYLIGGMSFLSVAYMLPGTTVTKPVNEDLANVSETEVCADNCLAGTIFNNTSADFMEVSQANKISGEGTASEPYIIANVEDMERLATILLTEGRFGVEYDTVSNTWNSWFNVPEGARTSRVNVVNHIRTATFNITGNIRLQDRGIVRLNRRSNVASFAGSFIGVKNNDTDTYPTIYQDVDTSQDNVYFIPYATANIQYSYTKNGNNWTVSTSTGNVDNQFKNFNISGNVQGRNYVGGFIYSYQMANSYYGDLDVDNVHMNDLYVTAKNDAATTLTSGLFESINANSLSGWVNNTNILTKPINIKFKNVSFSGGLYTYGNNDSRGAAIADYIYCPRNNFMYDTENKNITQISLSNIEFTGEIKQYTQGRNVAISAILGNININSNNNYINGVDTTTEVPIFSKVKLVSFNKLNVQNVNIHDVKFSAGNGCNNNSATGSMLIFEMNYVKADIKDVTLRNISYNVQESAAAGVLIYNNYFSFVNMDNIDYDKVTLIKTSNSQNGVSMLLYRNCGVVHLSNHNVNDSVIMLGNKINRMYELYYESENGSINNTNVCRGVFSLENAAYNINDNGYTSPYIYCQYSADKLDENGLATGITQAQNDSTYQNQAIKSYEIYYNLHTNMGSNKITGTGTIDDPFIIDSKEKLTIVSSMHVLNPNLVVDYADMYFSDIDEVVDNSTEYVNLQMVKKFNALYTGYYVITADINFDNCTYYPLRNVCGNIYGFNVEKYLGHEPTQEEQKTYATAAAKALEGKSSILSLNVVNNNKPKIEFHADNIQGGIISDNVKGGAVNMVDNSGNTKPTSSVGDQWNSPCSYTYGGLYSGCQNSLFGHIFGSNNNVSIANIEISGVVASNNKNTNTGGGSPFISGVNLYGISSGVTVDIHDIDFSGNVLIVQRQTSTYNNDSTGLLIDNISESKVNISNIKILNNSNIRADALIGYQTGNSSVVKLEKIDLNAAIDPGTVIKNEDASNASGYADYGKIETSEAQGKWRKPGTEAYAKYGFGFRYGYYYYNLESGVAIYSYENGDIVTPGRRPLTNPEKRYDETTNDYRSNDATVQNQMLLARKQKYAYKTLSVSVNPLSANITKGKGTKENPYIISNIGQLATLERFIKSNSGSMIATDWYVGESEENAYSITDGEGNVQRIGYDSDNSDTWNDPSNILYNSTGSSTTDYLNSVKTRLCKSYYRVENDLDFTDQTSPFASLMESFTGLGTSSYSFAGVIEGKLIAYVEDGQTKYRAPVIRMGNSSFNTYTTSYGLIYYGKGFKVKNLEISNGYQSTEANDFDAQIKYTKDEQYIDYILYNTTAKAGLVAAYIIGGDNVIQDVKISASIKFSNTPNTTSAHVGAYVGRMQYGTLTIAGINEETFKNFKLCYGDSNKLYNPTSYAKYVSAIVGQQYDGGYIVYREDELSQNKISTSIVEIDTSRKLTEKTIGDETYSACEISEINYLNLYGVPCSNSTNIINQKYLDSIGKIKVVFDERTSSDEDEQKYITPYKQGRFICEINDANQLYLYSLIMCSGSLSAGYANGPYSSGASCQKIEEDFTSWINEENRNCDDSSIEFSTYNLFPAVFKYFDFTSLNNSYKDVIVSSTCVLNANQQKNNINNRTTFMLVNSNPGYVYDMASFGNAFKGIGRRNVSSYSNTQNVYTSLGANFDGNGHTINVGLYGIGPVGLFTELYADNKTETKMYIENFNLTGHIEQTGESVAWAMVGGVSGLYRNGFYCFENIALTDLSIVNRYNSASETDGMIGGIIGFCVADYSNYRSQNISFRDITIGATKEDGSYGHVLLKNYNDVNNKATSSAGGLAGRCTRLVADNVNVNNLTIESNGNIGALAGSIYNNINNASHCSYITNCNVSGCNFISHSKNKGLGGLVGELYEQFKDNDCGSLYNVTSTNNTFVVPDDNQRVGAIVGYHYGAGRKEILKLEHNGNIRKEDSAVTQTQLENPWNCEQLDDTSCVCIYYNDFCNIEEAEQKYGIERYDENDSPLVAYADFLEENFFTTVVDDNEVAVDLIPDTPSVDNKIIRWSSESKINVLAMLNSVLGSLTNNSGIINSTGLNIGNCKIINIDIKGMEIQDGVVSESGSTVLKLDYRDTTKEYSITTTNTYDKFEKKDDNGNTVTPATYSLVTIKYAVGKNFEYYDTITIPLFISNMINVDIYSKVYIGQEYDVDAMRKITLTASDTQKATSDSSYTVYTEYMYSSNREEYDESLHMYKGFSLYNASNATIAKGTKLTLVDLTFEDDVRTYYYTVNEPTTFVPLMNFVDEKGNSYKERDLNSLTELPVRNYYDTMYVNGRTIRKYNRGVERYLLFVDCSNTYQDASLDLNTVYSPLIVNGVASTDTEHTIKDVFYVKKRTYNTLSTSPGRTIQWDDDSVSAQGEISKDKQLHVNAQFTDKASDYYWDNLMSYDYNNTNKYLEVAIYLVNEAGDKVMLPSGTRIKYPGYSDVIYEAVQNSSSVFYYKDSPDRQYYSLMDNRKNDGTSEIEFTLDFTYAKMENMESGNYKLCMEIVRTDNHNFPMGDDIVDTITIDSISLIATVEYGFKLDTDSKVAINKKDLPQGNDIVVDCSTVLSSNLPQESVDNKIANQTMKVNYSLLMKNEYGDFVPYDGTCSIKMEIIENTDITNIKEVIFSSQNNDFEYILKDMSSDGQDAHDVKCHVTFPFGTEISNYKLLAKYSVDSEEIAQDFIIINIADVEH